MFSRLQKVGLCLSHGSTIKLVDELGKGFDDVLKWKADAESCMDVIVSIKTKKSIMCYLSLFFYSLAIIEALH